MAVLEEDLDIDQEIEDTEEQPEQTLSFEEKFVTWDQSLVVKVKDPKARAYVLDQIFWNHEKHHKSEEFYVRVLGFIKKAIERYGIEEQQYDEDLPIQIYNKICEAIDAYYNPYKANVVTFLHKVLFNHIKLRAYHIKKYKDGTFYDKFYTYENIIKSVTRNVTMMDRIILENYFDHFNNIKIDDNTRHYLKGDLIRIAPRNNIWFKAIIWELLQSSEDMEIGKLNNRTGQEDIVQRRSKIRRS